MKDSLLTAADKAKKALEIYRDRGFLACEALEKNDVDEFFHLLNKRKAAFHNFRALDHIARGQGVDLAIDPEVQLLWQDIQQTNTRLAEVSQKTINEIDSQVTRLANGRAISQKYGSGSIVSCKLRKCG